MDAERIEKMRRLSNALRDEGGVVTPLHAVGRIATLALNECLGEIERLEEHETWLKLGHEAADGFLDMPSQSHIVDKVCIIGHERDELRGEIDQLRKLVGELRDILPIERLEEGGDPGWLADLKRRAAEAAEER